jgi:hypothetical protein
MTTDLDKEELKRSVMEEELNTSHRSKFKRSVMAEEINNSHRSNANSPA